MRIRLLKTKFDILVKASEQKIKMCEQAISQINQKIREHEEGIDQILHQMHELEIPFSGSSLLFSKVYENKRICLDLIDAERKKISHLKSEKQQREQEYHQFSLELEKMRFLQKQEIQLRIEQRKLREQKESDEIAGMRFILKEKKNEKI